VGPVGNEGRIDVSRGQDPILARKGLAGEGAVVPGAVEALVV
jgi:hypothetical protein